MKKAIFALCMAAVIAMSAVATSVVSMMTPSAAAAAVEAVSLESSTWFYNQLTLQGKRIYSALTKMYNSGIMLDGQGSYDLVANGVIDSETVDAYMNGDRTLFNDFAAAKDAWDLEHPEAWYVDSSYLTMRTTQDSDGKYHVYIGPGRSDNYYVSGVRNAEDVKTRTAALEEAVNAIVESAEGTDVEKIRYVHRQVINSISYRFETECSEGNAGYVRTAYGLVTHEGVCEAYARSMQMILNKLGIDCVLVHGIQSSGEPEAHMWNAVKLDDEWYVVDATWDDPIGLDRYGNIIRSDVPGIDGGETETYLLVGQDVVGRNWHESGYVSTGAKEFSYPEIALTSYGHGVFEKDGLTVTYADDLMEDTSSTVYHISFNGDGLTEAAKKGYYFLVKMYDLNADGSVDAFENWYYPAHMLHTMTNDGLFYPDDDFRDNGNKYYTDTDNYLTMSVSNCEYVEFAVTTKAPPYWQTAMDLIDMGGYYDGDGTDILAETGLMLNVNGDYEQPPYIKNASPVLNAPINAATEYRIHVEFTDSLYRPDQDSIINAVEGKVNDAYAAMIEDVTFDYRGTTYAWGVNARQPHEFAKKNSPENLVMFCDTHEQHSDLDEIDADCNVTGIEYDFTASDMWADDSVQYEFYLTGLVGRKSNKYPNEWSYVFDNNYPFSTCPLISGFNWNLWGQPMLLDNPNDLDLAAMTVSGVGGKEQSLADLTNSMNLDNNNMNGRLMLVVEDVNGNRDKTEELGTAMENDSDVPAEAIIAQSLYEIDFARICRCTIVETGQSVRLCVGFPAGVDASMAGITFKAYHFTRDDDGSIVSVEEIPCEVTQYGLVISCRRFSPFAIVALDNELLDEDDIDTSKSVIVSSEDGGVIVLEDGTVASGIDGIVRLEKGESIVLKAQANDGMRLLSVNVNGVNTDGDTVVVSYEDIEGPSAMVSASFISEAVVLADEDAGETVVAPEVVASDDETPGTSDGNGTGDADGDEDNNNNSDDNTDTDTSDSGSDPSDGDDDNTSGSGSSDDNQSVPGNNDIEHVHVYGKWQYDGSRHWKMCEDGDDFEIGAHNGQLHSDANGHWIVCEICGYTSAAEPHGYLNGACSTCGQLAPDVSGDDSGNTEGPGSAGSIKDEYDSNPPTGVGSVIGFASAFALTASAVVIVATRRRR